MTGKEINKGNKKKALNGKRKNKDINENNYFYISPFCSGQVINHTVFFLISVDILLYDYIDKKSFTPG